jgi:hypothetical protein
MKVVGSPDYRRPDGSRVGSLPVTPARRWGLAQNSGEVQKIGSHDPCQS